MCILILQRIFDGKVRESAHLTTRNRLEPVRKGFMSVQQERKRHWAFRFGFDDIGLFSDRLKSILRWCSGTLKREWKECKKILILHLVF